MRGSWRLGMVGAAVLAATCACPTSTRAAIALKLTTPTVTVAPGDSFYVDAEVASEDSSFNAFELVVRFDPAMVTFKPVTPSSSQTGPLMTGACGNVFHVFNAYPDSVIADASLLCSQTFVTGPGRIYRLKFKANATSGPAVFSAGVSTRFYKAGVYVNPVLRQGITLVVGSPLAVPGATAGPRGYVLEAPRPNPLRGGHDAAVAFALPAPAKVGLELIDLQGRVMASRDLGEAPAGSSTVRWAPPGLPAGRYELRMRADGRVVASRAWVVLR